MKVRIKFPPWSREVFDVETVNGIPVRYRVAYGGRGSTKSWEFARRLIRVAVKKKIRILCARELQVSIKDSVHKLLVDQIYLMGLQANFQILDKSIKSTIGTEFIFKGLRHNIQEIKSTEGIDICWIEEAHSVSKESWAVLDPTIRKSGSEIWLTFNPDLEDDPIYQMFVVGDIPEAIVRQVNYTEIVAHEGTKHWFTDELRRQMERAKVNDYISYLHVWKGACRTHSDAQILYEKWEVAPFTPKFSQDEHWGAPFFGADWGFSQDPTTLIKCYVYDDCIWIEHEAFAVGCDLDDTPELFDTVPDARKYHIYADCARPETIRHMNTHGYPNIKPCTKWPGSVADGIAHLRQYRKIIIHPRCKNIIDEARLYSYKIDPRTDAILPTIVDKHNHGIDALRYSLGKLIRKRTTSQTYVAGMV